MCKEKKIDLKGIFIKPNVFSQFEVLVFFGKFPLISDVMYHMLLSLWQTTQIINFFTAI